VRDHAPADHAPPDEVGLLALASRLMDGVGRGRPRALARLSGGKNNQVYRIDNDAGIPLILKRYFRDPRDPRDRLGAEWGFIEHARLRGVRNIPEPLACDLEAGLGLYSFVPGRKLTAAELAPRHVGAAIDFVVAVNRPPRAALAAGSEACFSLADHVATVERRVARLDALDPELPDAAQASRFVSEQLLPAWNAVKTRLVSDARAAGLAMAQALSADETCLSPSDFGFHNALVDPSGALSFLDFEYAGRDDPAKLVSDFFCQPEVPVPMSYHAEFVARLADGLHLGEPGRTRCRILLDVYRIKWTCIILNDFLPLGAARRAFADKGSLAARCANQLTKAKANIEGLPA